MKKLILLFVIACAMNSVHAQTWDEWFNQKETAKEYQLKQIAALRLYTGYLAEGIKVAYKGINLIGDIKSGDMNLHRAFFTSFSKINSAIKDLHSSGNDITNKQHQMLMLYRKVKNTLAAGSFTPGEKTYIHDVFSKLLDDYAIDTAHLILMTSNDHAELKDDERLKRIYKLKEEMEDKYLFSRHFAKGIEQLHINHVHERNSILLSRKLYGAK